jgi:Leucine-rich repeat (LRR) protein
MSSSSSSSSSGCDLVDIEVIGIDGSMQLMSFDICSTTRLELEHIAAGDVRGLTALTALRELSLHHNELLWCPDISKLSLEVLHLSFNRIGALPEDGLAHLASSLRELSIQQNRLRYLPDILRKFSFLTRLSLQGNRFADWTLVLGPSHRFQNVIQSHDQLIDLVDLCGDPQTSWHRLRAALTMICIALHELDLPAIQTVLIFDHLEPQAQQVKLHTKWRVVCAVKHARQRDGLLFTDSAASAGTPTSSDSLPR